MSCRLKINLVLTLQMTPVCFILWLQTNLIEENVSGQWEIGFHGVSLVKDREVY